MVDPTQPVPSPGLAPSASTTYTALSGAVVALIMYGASLKGVTFPAGIESAMTVVVCSLIGYLPRSGRS
jgi:hypothetical protein